MSFNQNETNVGYKPGFFLAHEECTRETRQIAQNHAQVVTADGKKHVPMGAIYPANDATAVGIVYEDVDVTTGAMPGSVVTAGTVYLDRLPTAKVIKQDAKGYLVTAEAFGEGIHMWLRSQGELLELVE